MGFEQCMPGIHHYCIIQNTLTALKMPCALSIHPPPPYESLDTTDLVTLTVVLPFPE